MTNISSQALEDYCRRLLCSAGVAEDCASTVAACLVDADLRGVASHGVSRMGIYLERLNRGLVAKDNRVRILREGPSTAVLDACNTMGAPAARYAMELCIRKARETGACFATVRGSNHFGTAAFYTRMAAEAGMIGFGCTNLTPKIAPFGAAEPFAGTDPISIAAPSLGEPFVLDMTPSVVALGKLILAQKLGQSIPRGWALDPDGNPTTDPAAGRQGSLIPLGGPKGSGLALAVEMLCGILSGAGCAPRLHDLYEYDAPQGVGHFFGALDISRFLDLDAFRGGLSAMMAQIKGLRRAEGVEEIFLPGERSARNAAENLRGGISLPDPVWDELNTLGAPYGLHLPAEPDAPSL